VNPWQTREQSKVIFQELMAATLLMTDALSKLLMEKAIITDEKFKKKL
jgi:hypothetical protein